MYGVLRRLLALWVKPEVRPESAPGSIGAVPGSPVCYVLERRSVTDLAVLDFGGAAHAPRLLTLHPGVTAAQVQEATGFPLEAPASVPVTPPPSAEQLELIRTRLDPRNLRATVFKGDPPGDHR